LRPDFGSATDSQPLNSLDFEEFDIYNCLLILFQTQIRDFYWQREAFSANTASCALVHWMPHIAELQLVLLCQLIEGKAVILLTYTEAIRPPTIIKSILVGVAELPGELTPTLWF
jgi:hypothetical protein